MRLINDFFHIAGQGTQDGVLHVKVAMNAEHGIYKVHFPGNPVTPGVCLMRMAKEIVEQHLGKALKLDTASNIRFRNPLLPMDTPTFVYTKIEQENEWVTVKLTVKDDEKQYVTMSLKFIEARTK